MGEDRALPLRPLPPAACGLSLLPPVSSSAPEQLGGVGTEAARLATACWSGHGGRMPSCPHPCTVPFGQCWPQGQFLMGAPHASLCPGVPGPPRLCPRPVVRSADLGPPLRPQCSGEASPGSRVPPRQSQRRRQGCVRALPASSAAMGPPEPEPGARQSIQKLSRGEGQVARRHVAALGVGGVRPACPALPCAQGPAVGGGLCDCFLLPTVMPL